MRKEISTRLPEIENPLERMLHRWRGPSFFLSPVSPPCAPECPFSFVLELGIPTLLFSICSCHLFLSLLSSFMAFCIFFFFSGPCISHILLSHTHTHTLALTLTLTLTHTHTLVLTLTLALTLSYSHLLTLPRPRWISVREKVVLLHHLCEWRFFDADDAAMGGALQLALRVRRDGERKRQREIESERRREEDKERRR